MSGRAGESGMIRVREGQAPGRLERSAFSERFRASFADRAFREEDEALARLEEIAWRAYVEGRKSLFQQMAGPDYADPAQSLSAEWGADRQRSVRRCGNPDPTTTSGKDADKAKALEMAGWDYPQHLAGRVYGVVVHGDVAGIEDSRRGLSDWLDWMGFIDAGPLARLDRFIGYYAPYADSHNTLDWDEPMQEDVRNVARAVAKALRAGRLQAVQPRQSRPRAK